MTDDKTLKREYRIRFGADGVVLGESSGSILAEELGFKPVLDGGMHIFDLIEDMWTLEQGLPEQLRPLVERLLNDHQEFALNGDFTFNGRTRHLRISGQSIRNLNNEYTHTLLFLDDTVHTELRRSYEYMFRLANHEIKGPLAVILGATEHAEEHAHAGNTEGVLTCLAMIERNAHAIEDMITRYLNLSRIESGSILPVFENVLLSSDLCDPLFAELQLPLKRKGMSARFDLDELDSEPVVRAAREMVEIVLRNLLSNAVKYGDPNSEIRVSLAKRGPNYAVTVANAGPNIPQEYLNKLFQRFMRLDATRGTKGSGLGLYNARKLVEIWGGTIAVESGEHTTRFIFTLPQ